MYGHWRLNAQRHCFHKSLVADTTCSQGIAPRPSPNPGLEMVTGIHVKTQRLTIKRRSGVRKICTAALTSIIRQACMRLRALN
jgi:hypothetical protein